MKEYAGLKILEQLLFNCPDSFSSSFGEYFDTITDITYEAPILVQSEAVVALSFLSNIDPKQFIEISAEFMMELTERVLMEFPAEIVDALVRLIGTVPEFIESKLDTFIGFCEKLKEEADCCFSLLSALIERFPGIEIKLINDFAKELLKSKCTPEFRRFYVLYAKLTGREIPREIPEKLMEKAEWCIENEDKVEALRLLAELPGTAITNGESILEFVTKNSLLEPEHIRKIIPSVIYNIAESTESISTSRIIERLYQLAVFDPAPSVRQAIIRVLIGGNVDQVATGESIKFLKLFANDDSMRVRKLVFRLIAKVSEKNPMGVSAITRHSILEHFYIITHVPGIRMQARIVDTFPELIRAASFTMKTYIKPFMDIARRMLMGQAEKRTFENFLEEQGQIKIDIGLMESISLLAPMAPELIAEDSRELIKVLCGKLEAFENRPLILSTLRLLFVLMSPPATSLPFRVMAPLVLASCSKLLSATHSRKARMEIFRVIGAIGVMDVHQSPPPKSIETPKNMDDELARQFFHPSRDIESDTDDTLLLKGATADQCYIGVVSKALMQVLKDASLKDYYGEAASALCEVLSSPRMFMLAAFDSYVSRLLDIIEQSDDEELRIFLPILAKLINESAHNTTPFAERALNIITRRFNSRTSDLLLDVLIAFLSVLRDGFARYASIAICLLVPWLDSMKSVNWFVSAKVLKAFTLVAKYSSDLLYLVVPQICDAIVSEHSLPEVRASGLKALSQISHDNDLFMYLGPVVRALNFSIGQEEESTKKEGFELLINLLRTQGQPFMFNAQPLLGYLKATGLLSRRLEEEIERAEQIESFTPILDERNQSGKKHKEAEQHTFSEDAIIARAMTPALGYGRHLEQWLHSLVINCISSSPNGAIRACTTVATTYHPLAINLFKIAFFSCWEKISENGKETIATSFRGIITASENYESVAHEILDLVFFMNKLGIKMNISSKDLANAALRYGCSAFALSLQEGAFSAGHQRAEIVNAIIDTYIKLGDWDSAIGIWKKCSSKGNVLNRPEILTKLRMWDQVMPHYKQKFEKTQDPAAFAGLIESEAALSMWPDLLENIGTFNTLNRTQKRELSPLFGQAAFHLEQWDELEKILVTKPDDSVRCKLMTAIASIHSGDLEPVDEIINSGFSLLASRPVTFWADNQQINKTAMLYSQQLVEVLELKEWIKSPENRGIIETVWNQRLITAPHEFETWSNILSNREHLTHVKDSTFIDFFQLKSQSMGMKTHGNAFDTFFSGFDLERSPDIDKLCFVLTRWNTGSKKLALREMKKLCTQLHGELQETAHNLYATWMLEATDDLQGILEAYSHLKSISVVSALVDSKEHVEKKEGRRSSFNLRRMSSDTGNLSLPRRIVKSMEIDVTNIEVLRKWSDVNCDLASRDPHRIAKYVTNAIDALAECCKLSPSFTDVVQLLNLFFEHAEEGDVFEQTKKSIKQLSVGLLLKASSQLLVQLSHPSPDVASFVHDLVFQLLDEHYHGLIFSLIVNTFSTNQKRAAASTRLYGEFTAAHPEESEEVTTIRKCLLRAAVTWYEKVLQRITDAFDHYSMNNFDKMASSLQSIIKMSKKPKCELHDQFLKEYGSQINMLGQIMLGFSPTNTTAMNQVSQWCKNMQDAISEDIRKVRLIELSSLSAQLGERTHFKLAVPGTYKPGKPIIRIEYFVGQFSVYMSKQQPKDVVVRGEDGQFYQYLVKGHEDLRLDERIQQFFKLINTFLKRETVFHGHQIVTMSVIPLSIQHGLVQWVRGTDTLRSLVEQYRKLYGRDTMEEYTMLEQYSYPSFDYMLPIQKQQVIEKVMGEVADTDIANFFKLKADTADTWVKQTRMFAISNAMMSIVGYIIGLGDRHPSNLLIDRLTGKVVHIDFGDCFERAAKRRFLPEVVPFRLTRMMVRAMGVSGTEGAFRGAFVNMANILRENRRVLVMVLSIFVHEPLVDPDENAPSRTVSGGRKSGVSQPSFVNPVVTGSVMDKGRVIMAESSQAQSSIEMRSRVNQKLSGTDFGTPRPLSVEAQADLLIQAAVDPYNLAKMYSGWCAFW